ncbi:uncharacterized protein LACBIDRAFT_307095 [Laccaria bicolor S238N-H82]|uniref:separase n=1 Tax=Laccaria bicolor (strain S238N-H82 / ATCC MYA-4686) TaxID=486041 RepID=B0DPD5_LACBS|nr:uncharacterized protein LACBIDRAFT_307095 [Laccaria bicolor S238N-H82]EDR03598.1 predicted protein [Laccaria bicolor S238N-H82]|eukprot:XP_001885746.1 predicted protein [Laccaria bicolor S238N-H82]
MLSCAQKREDGLSFLEGKGFVGFCEYWMAFAKRAGDICALERIGQLMQHELPKPSSSKIAQLVGRTQAQDADNITKEATRICAEFAQVTTLLEQRPVEDDVLIKHLESCTVLIKTSTCLQSLLFAEDQELARISGKVDRAFERLRRMAVKSLDSLSTDTSRTEVQAFVLSCVDLLQKLAVSAARKSDIITRVLDSLFVLARTALNVQDPRTYVPAFEHLSGAVSILDSVPQDADVDRANYMRCISGTYYNVSGSLYQATRYGAAVPFLREACLLGAKALSMNGRGKGKGKGKEEATKSKVDGEMEWNQLEEQLYRRWELLAVCYSKNGDRKNAYDAFQRCICTFPFTSSGFEAQMDAKSVGDIFGASASSSVKQLMATIDRVSYIGACELLLPPEDVSLRFPQRFAASHDGNPVMDPGVVGVLLEQQIDGLQPSQWKEGVRGVFVKLLRDSLYVYDAASFPIRRSRVLIRCMAFAYRDSGDDWAVILGNVQEMGSEVERLLTAQNLARDVALAPYRLQYRASAHLWLALHAHKRADPEQSTAMAQHADQACQILKDLLTLGPAGSPRVARKGLSPKVRKVSSSLTQIPRIVSPKATRATRQRVPAAPKKAAPVKSKSRVAARLPVTPQVKPRAAPQPVSLNTARTPPRPSLDAAAKTKSLLTFDDFDQFLGLLQLTARLLGLLCLVIPKVHILDLTRKLCERHAGVASDGYISASIDLAHEYVKIGKMKRAAMIFNLALEVVRNGQASPEVSSAFLLRFAESLALIEDVSRSSNVYNEALVHSSRLDTEEKGSTTLQRIHTRVKRLERAAMASHIFGLIQYCKEDVATSLEGMLQSLRLWNRAVDTLGRLNPFTITTYADSYPPRSFIHDLEWRTAEGLFSTLFALSQMYLMRGSPREAEYFAQQAQDLAEALNVPTVVGRALTRKAEVQLHLGQLQEANATLEKAAALPSHLPGIDTIIVHRLRAECNERSAQHEDAQEHYLSTMKLLEELDGAFQQFETLAFGPRRSLGTSPRTKLLPDTVAPELLAAVLHQHIWSRRDQPDEDLNSLLEKFLSLPSSSRMKVNENSLMGKLTLYNVYARFRADMFLSSLTESTIAIPMGMSTTHKVAFALPTQDVLNALEEAEKLFQANLSLTSRTGSILKLRDAAISLALIKAFQTSLGRPGNGGSVVTATLLDVSTAITLRREMLESIEHKFSALHMSDDLQWPLITSDGTPRPRPKIERQGRFNVDLESDDDAEDSALREDTLIRAYWTSIREKYRSRRLDVESLSTAETGDLPENWIIININITDDKSTLFISRREGGVEGSQPLVFCVPLKGRRDNGDDNEEDHLGFDDAIGELREIVRLSDEGTKTAVNIKSDDAEARANWWKLRGDLDTRLRELLENIEFCWLGAFKTILSPRSDATPEMILDLRAQFDKIFQRSLHVKDQKTKQRAGNHKKTTSQAQAPSQLTLDDPILKCFSTLSPKCKDEELEDLIYFILDLYSFHGVPVAIAEVDIAQLVVDLRAVLEEHAAKLRQRKKTITGKSTTSLAKDQDEHLFLVLDKNVQGIPWESIPILRGRSVSRIPNIEFLYDRLAFAKWKRQGEPGEDKPITGAVVDPRKGYFILNPSGDLARTEGRFRDWAHGMKKAGWDGVIGQAVSEQQFVNALKTQDLVVYFGHGGGEQYIRSHRIRSLPKCAATMLWGCSSGALRELGDFDRTGTPYNYMLAGCPTLVANLWDVTDKDIDKFSQSIFDKLGLTPADVSKWNEPRKESHTSPSVSLVASVAQSRDSCKLKYLTGAAPVVYGIPFYL